MSNPSHILDATEMRKDYSESSLLEPTPTCPFTLFSKWFEDASQTQVEPNAMVLSTCSESGIPSSRVVLLKSATPDGFTFFTNYNSSKSREMTGNPYTSLVFYWGQRQVRIEGLASKIPADESDEYFKERPRGSQIGAYVSEQSKMVESRDVMEERVKEFEKKFENVDVIPRPEWWGGWRVTPYRIEFWQGRPSRLHDRIEYTRPNGTFDWKSQRLYP